jgi:IS5 family transposase
MRSKERRGSGQSDFFRARLDQIVDMGHPLAKLARSIDWRFLEERLGAVYSDRAGHPPLPTRLMAGLSILKSMHDLSDEALCERWVENPYFQLFCGEEFFQHKTPFDRSSLTRWRQRMGGEKLTALIQESLATAARTGAAKPSDFGRVIVDTTVQPKAVAFPADAKLMHQARERLVRLAKKTGVSLRQSYERVGKRALIAHQRYAHAKQFKRANRALRTIRTYLGRVCRDLVRKTRDDGELRAIFAQPLSLAFAVREQRQHKHGWKIYSLHAPEVECIGKGKAHRPYEFGVKVSLATTLHRSKGGQFIAHVKAMPGNPYDGHTLATVLPEIEAQIGAPLARVVADRGYRGHNAPPNMRFKIYLSGQRRGVTDAIKRELRRRSAVEPVIGHAKAEHGMSRNFLKGHHGDASNAVLAAAGYNFRRLLAWVAALWRVLVAAIISGTQAPQIERPASPTAQPKTPPCVLHGRLGKIEVAGRLPRRFALAPKGAIAPLATLREALREQGWRTGRAVTVLSDGESALPGLVRAAVGEPITCILGGTFQCGFGISRTRPKRRHAHKI